MWIRLIYEALRRDDTRIYSYRAGDPNRSTIDIYSSAGKLIKQLNVCVTSLIRSLRTSLVNNASGIRGPFADSDGLKKSSL